MDAHVTRGWQMVKGRKATCCMSLCAFHAFEHLWYFRLCVWLGASKSFVVVLNRYGCYKGLGLCVL